MGGGRGERRDVRWGFGRGGEVEGGGAGVVYVGVCLVGRWLKAASGGFGSVVVVLVVRRERNGRRKVGRR